MEKKQPLKKFFILMAVWFVTIMAVFAGSTIYDRYKSSEYDAVAGPYLQKIIPELSKWDPAITRGLMAAEVSSTIPEENFTQAMTLFSRLGTLQSLGEPSFDQVDQLATDKGTLPIVIYDIDAKYANADAVINLKLLFRDGIFEIYRFNFSSELLLE